MPTFGETWRKVRLYVPDAPALLVQTWVQDAYATLTDYRPWLWTYEFGQLTWADAVEVDVTVTAGSPTVTSAALFTSAMVGRQFRVGTFPIYTVAAMPDTSTLTLDANYQGATTGATTAQILDAYPVMPPGFRSFMALVDPVLQRWVPWWMTNEELDLLDPTRTAAQSSPQVLASLDTSPLAATLGQVRYQYWPIPEEAGALQAYFRMGPAALSEDTPFKGVLATRSDVLETGALAAAAKWPGTRERPNPYFNLQLARQLDADFQQGIFQLDLRDDDQNPLSWGKIPWERWSAWTWAYNTRYLQMTDATLNAYFGMGWYPSWSGGW